MRGVGRAWRPARWLAAGCGERDRLTFPVGNPGDGVGPRTDDHPARSRRHGALRRVSRSYSRGSARIPTGWTRCTSTSSGAGICASPRSTATAADTVRFAIQLPTFGHAGDTIMVRIFAVDADGRSRAAPRSGRSASSSAAVPAGRAGLPEPGRSRLRASSRRRRAARGQRAGQDQSPRGRRTTPCCFARSGARPIRMSRGSAAPGFTSRCTSRAARRVRWPPPGPRPAGASGSRSTARSPPRSPTRSGAGSRWRSCRRRRAGAGPAAERRRTSTGCSRSPTAATCARWSAIGRRWPSGTRALRQGRGGPGPGLRRRRWRAAGAVRGPRRGSAGSREPADAFAAELDCSG